ncbi:MAG: nitronate monooxygenase [Bdellovibrionota bacterium]
MRALKIFLRSAKRANRYPDYVVVEGPLAGGHLGFGNDWKSIQLKDIVKEVLQYLDDEDLSIPVIPAGGIFTGTDAVEYLEMGAAAVQVATRFTITKECGFPPNVKQKYLRSTEENVVVNSASPTGYLMRMLDYSPSLKPGIKPMCEPFGYALDQNGDCQYLTAYYQPEAEKKTKAGEADKMCLCYQFSNHNCYTCGHYVYRLKDTTTKLPDGNYVLPTAEEVFKDYQYSANHMINVAGQATAAN